MIGGGKNPETANVDGSLEAADVCPECGASTTDMVIPGSEGGDIQKCTKCDWTSLSTEEEE